MKLCNIIILINCALASIMERVSFVMTHTGNEQVGSGLRIGGVKMAASHSLKQQRGEARPGAPSSVALWGQDGCSHETLISLVFETTGIFTGLFVSPTITITAPPPSLPHFARSLTPLFLRPRNETNYQKLLPSIVP